MYDGRSYVEIRRSRVDRAKLLEIVVHAGPGGTLVVDGIDIASRMIAEDPVYRKDREEGAEPALPQPAPEIRPRERWAGTRLAYGTWDPGKLKAFLERRDLAPLSPYVIFDLRPDDRIGDVLACLAGLKSAAGSRVVPQIHRRR